MRWCYDLKREKRRVRHRHGYWIEKSSNEYIHFIWYSTPGQTTRAQHYPQTGRWSTPLLFCTINMYLSYVHLNCKGQRFLHLSSAGSPWLFRRSAWRNMTPAALNTSIQLQGEICKFLPHRSLSVPCQSHTLICLRGVSWQPCLFTQGGRLPV